MSVEICDHLSNAHAKEPNTRDGCEECLKIGSGWVHLRVCLECGKVGCCDNSPNKHATAHFHETHHPLVQSLEPNEEWVYCYEDDMAIESL
ncbi:MAG: UBP-type zinc finger domain-containing protein [Actinomycetota bacterium]